MKVRNKISRRAQAISAIAVVLVFGGGWLAVWKWPHIKLRYMIFKAGPDLRSAMATRAQWLTIPEAASANWIPLDLGILSISVPPSIEKIETKDAKSACIETTDLQIGIPNYFSGREISDDFRTRIRTRLLDSNGNWRDAGFVEYCHAAGIASSEDFRWSLSLEQTLSLQQLLFFKAMNASKDTTWHFDTHTAMGVISWSPPGSVSGYEFGRAAIYATDKGDHDGIVLWCRPKVNGGQRLIETLVASFRFPEKRFGGTTEDLTQRMELLGAKVAASTQPAQP